MSRKDKDREWNIHNPAGATTWEKVPVAVLMDIRDELKKLNALLHCPNFQQIPHRLRRISRNTYAAKHGKEPRRSDL